MTRLTRRQRDYLDALIVSESGKTASIALGISYQTFKNEMVKMRKETDSLSTPDMVYRYAKGEI